MSATSGTPGMRFANLNNKGARRGHACELRPRRLAALEHLSGIVRDLDGARSPAAPAPQVRRLMGSLWQGATERFLCVLLSDAKRSCSRSRGSWAVPRPARRQFPRMRVHLVAHSVGARLAVHASRRSAIPMTGATIKSVALLQEAHIMHLRPTLTWSASEHSPTSSVSQWPGDRHLFSATRPRALPTKRRRVARDEPLPAERR
jgi:hypothetical protein